MPASDVSRDGAGQKLTGIILEGTEMDPFRYSLVLWFTVMNHNPFFKAMWS